jgi:hypothetical protein
MPASSRKPSSRLPGQGDSAGGSHGRYRTHNPPQHTAHFRASISFLSKTRAVNTAFNNLNSRNEIWHGFRLYVTFSTAQRAGQVAVRAA